MRKQIYLKDEEAGMLEDLSMVLDKSQSNVVRTAIRKMYDSTMKKRKDNPLLKLVGASDSEVPKDFSENLDKHIYDHE